MPRRNGWELPFHLLQVVAITVFSLLLVAFYAFLAPFLGKTIYEYVAMGVYSLLALGVLILYVRSAAIDPADTGILTEADKASTYKSHNELEQPGTTSSVEEPEKGGLRYGEQGSRCCSKVGGFFCGFLAWQDCRKDEHLLPQAGEEGLFCTLCNTEVRKLSKHCRSCNKCVDGFDHHCRWLNNCVGRKNYISFVCLMAVTLLWFIFECGVGIAVLVRCFADRKAMENQIPERLGDGFSRPPFAVVVALCTALSFLAIVPLGELFFFHMILIRKGITTYEYVVAMRAQSEPPGPSADGGDQLSYPSSPTSSAVTAISGRSSIGKGLPYKGAWCTPPRIFMDHPDEIIPHLEPGRLPSTMDPDTMHTSKKGKLPQQPVRISAWNLAKLNSKEAIKAGEKARASSSVLRPVSSKNHPHEGEHLSTSNASGRTSPMSSNQRFNLQNTTAQNQEDLESCVNSISNLSSPCSYLTPSPFDQNREHHNPVYQSSANQSPFSTRASERKETTATNPFSTRASERKETTATNDNLQPQIPAGRNLLGPNDITRPLVVWNQEAGRFVSASTRSAGSSQGLAGAELLHTGQSIFFGGPLGAGATPSYYQQGRSQRGGQLPVFVPSDSQQNQFSSRLP